MHSEHAFDSVASHLIFRSRQESQDGSFRRCRKVRFAAAMDDEASVEAGPVAGAAKGVLLLVSDSASYAEGVEAVDAGESWGEARE